MTVRPNRPTGPHRLVRDDLGRVVYQQQDPAAGQGAGGYVVVFLMLLALVVLCVSGYLLVRLLLPDREPALLPSFATWTPTASSAEPSAQPTVPPTAVSAPGAVGIAINPERGYINALVTVTGQGWWPGEPVFVFLRSPEEGDSRGYSYAAAVADDWGNFRTAFTFPNEMRWIGQEWADVIARGTRSGQEISTRFTIVAPTPTHTLPPPTPRPTLAATNTPVPSPTPLPTETPLPSPTPQLITDWRGEYYVGMILSGDPTSVRNDVAIDFNWGPGSPGDGIPGDGFSARWTRRLYFDEGMYRFTALADDGMRVWIDGRLWLDEWHDSTQETYVFDLSLPAGEHALQVEYYENLGGARAFLEWIPFEPPTATPTPTDMPLPIPEPTVLPPDEGWRAEYYGNVSLEGSPVLTRVEPSLFLDWGPGAPDPIVPADDFSARWTREVWRTAGTYRYFLEADDGARFWLNGELLLNAWPATIGQTYVVEIYLPDGLYVHTVEFFEVTGNARLHFWGEAIP